MIVKLDYDFADEITRYSLMDTYINLSEDIKNNKNADDEDIKIWKETIEAIEILGKWYFFDFGHDVLEYKKLLKKEKKK